MTQNAASDREDWVHKERLLQVYYGRLRDIDENNRSLTNFFFGVDTAILALVLQAFQDSWQGVVLAAVGYFASVALVLTGYKSYWSWRAYYREVPGLEDELGYSISAKHDRQLERSPAKSVRVTLIRLRFNLLFLMVWVFLLVYLVFTIPAPWPVFPSYLAAPLGVLIILALVCLPWLYLVGTLRPSVIGPVLRVPWARNV